MKGCLSSAAFLSPLLLFLVFALACDRVLSLASFQISLRLRQQTSRSVFGVPNLIETVKTPPLCLAAAADGGDLFSDLTTPTTKTKPVATVVASGTHLDKNDKELAVGAIVRVSTAGLKAFQVPPKGRGTFNKDKEFVPVKGGKQERAVRHLLLPVGLRGTVTKVYDIDEVSANFPVQVKFVPGQNTDEGYDPPVSFLMHFSADEVECAP